MGNVSPEKSPLSWILNRKRIFLGEWGWGCRVLNRAFLWLECHRQEQRLGAVHGQGTANSLVWLAGISKIEVKMRNWTDR